MALELASSAEGEIKAVNWLWDRRVPRGNMSILVGEEGFGKSTFLCWLAARLSKGELPGDCLGRPINTLILSAEDGVENTLNPRLQAAGADRGRVFFLKLRNANGDHQGLTLPADTGALLETITAYGIELLIIDPINAYLDTKTDSHNDRSIRGALGPIVAAAEDGRYGFIGVLHINKGSDRSERAAMMGSAGYRNAARSTLVFGLDPDEPNKDGARRVIVHGDKHNLSKRQPGYKIEIVEKLVDATDGTTIWVPAHELTDETWVSSKDVLEASVDKKPRKADAADEAADFLEAELSGGPRLTVDINAAAKECGVSTDALKKARERMGVETDKLGFQGKWQLKLPAAWIPSKALLSEAL